MLSGHNEYAACESTLKVELAHDRERLQGVGEIAIGKNGRSLVIERKDGSAARTMIDYAGLPDTVDPRGPKRSRQ
jgi:hypothetical protein